MENIKPNMVITVEKGDRTFRFEMPVGAPLGECYDAAFEMLREIVNLSDKAVQNAKPKDEEKSEEDKVLAEK